jgi:L-alanine-DL-glutamate epimerase-like enolase superfamily enzyme
MKVGPDPSVQQLKAQAFTIPTDFPEADGTASWDSTTIVVVEAEAGGRRGVGYTYADASIVSLIQEKLAEVVVGNDAMNPPAAWRAMEVAVRNLGRAGLAATAISAVDSALWDLKAVMLDRSLAALLGCYRQSVPIYGSGGFTSYDDRQLARQLAGWVEAEGCRWVKMKIGSEPERDPKRVAAAKQAIGSATLFVDANGAYSRKQALRLGETFAAAQDVRWFEEPVSSDDLMGLRLLRDRAPPAMEIAAGEYGYTLDDFRRLLEAGAVDVLQADATRCGGVTGFLQAAALCEAHHTDLSAHCAPALHRHLGCAAPRFRHLEWFHDHVRIERMLFDGAPEPRGGVVEPDHSRPGLGLTLKRKDAERFAVGGVRAS